MNAEEREMYETAKKGGGQEGVGSLEAEDRTGLTGRKVFPKNVPGNNKQEPSGKAESEKKKDEDDSGMALLFACVTFCYNRIPLTLLKAS